MKANQILSAVALTTALAFSACTNDDNALNSNSDNSIKLTASLAATTRTTNTDVQSTQLANLNSIGTYITGTGVSYVNTEWEYSSSSGTLSTTSTVTYPTDGSTVNIYAYAPYQEYTNDEITSAEAELEFYVDPDQSDDDGYINSDLLVATPVENQASTTNAVSLTFNHMLSKVIVNLAAGSGVDLTDATISIPKVAYGVKFSLNSTTLKSTDNLTSEKITMATFASGATTFSAAAIVVPQTILANSDLFTIALSNGTTLTYAPSSNVTFETNKQYTYNLTVSGDATSATLTSAAITNWDTTGDPTSGTMTESTAANLYDAIVVADYNGEDGATDTYGVATYGTIEAAINAATTGTSTNPFRIFVTKGTYNSTSDITISGSYIHLIGEDEAGTIIASTSSNVMVLTGSNLYFENMTIQHSTGVKNSTSGTNYPVIYFNGGTSTKYYSFYNCTFATAAIPWYVNATGPYVYAENCYFSGSQYHVYGNGNVLVENSILYNTHTSGSTYFAHANHGTAPTFGYVFTNCTYNVNTGITVAYLTRNQNNGKSVLINPTGNFDLTNNYNIDLNSTESGYSATYLYYASESTEGASTYSYENFIATDETGAWTPQTYYTTEVGTPSVSTATLDGTTYLTWGNAANAACYLVFKDATLVSVCSTRSYAATESGSYTVVAANTYGHIGTASTAVTVE